MEERKPLKRAEEVSDLLEAVQQLLIPFIHRADEDSEGKSSGHGLAASGGGPRATLVEHHKPEKLVQLLNFDLPDIGKGKNGLLETIKHVLQYSVNTWYVAKVKG
ncbi:MAG: hypothetical protein M1812_000365 [Candelaria pacifica]|nr:MAG: hypothetical protein M1812_000365 [Candelaria pacifica]